MERIATRRFSAEELESAESRFGIGFPPDLKTVLMNIGIVSGVDWTGPEEPIRARLRSPIAELWKVVAQGRFWCPSWGALPVKVRDRKKAIKSLLSNAPPLIPIAGGLYIPERPSERDNPVLSINNAEVVVYFRNLDEMVFEAHSRKPVTRPTAKEIPFWTDLARNGRFGFIQP